MVRSTQAVHLSRIKISTISERTVISFHLCRVLVKQGTPSLPQNHPSRQILRPTAQYSRPRPYSTQNQSQSTSARASQRSSASSDLPPSRLTPMTSSRRPSPVMSSRRSTPLHSYCFARPRHCNTLSRVRTGPYLFLLRNETSPCHAGSPRNL
jgi:hypothetical protein